VYAGKEMRHTTKLFKNTNLENCLFRPKKASKKERIKLYLRNGIYQRKCPDCGMQYKRQIGVCFLPGTLYTYRLSETTPAVKASF
jgi:hypothetical protein